QLPPRIVFIGGGYISFEFAHIVARAGVRPTILHRGPRPLVRFDPDLVDRLVSASREVGIDVQLDTQVEGIESITSGLIVATSIKGHKRKFETDLVVHGGGRVPNIDSLDLQAAGVRYDPRGVIVNEFFQSVSNPVVYATGDCANSGPPLTPVAGRESKIAAENMLKGNHATLDYTGVSSVVFTIPPLASVGLQEDEARKQNLDFEVKQADTAGWYASRRVNEKHSAYKVLVEKNSGRILGAHLLGNHTDELINLFALAIRFDLRSDDLKDLMYAYPTHGSNIPYMV
ncbi:NAD(P)/FAD-dependent oxidoreductase, partial [bacterium]|nr:NAD(P)/FAD-dependent oxidoreductase [bacterium]